MSNPYQPFFDKLDRTVDDIEAGNAEHVAKESADLLRRAGFVLANLLNVQAQVYPTLFLEPTPVAGDVVEDTSDSSVGES